jgi:HK97 family phage major capsid protein
LFGNATCLENLHGNISIPRMQSTPWTSAGSGYVQSTTISSQIAENATAPLAYPTWATSNASLVPSRVSCDIACSKQLLVQSHEALEPYLRREILRAISSFADNAMLNGVGSFTGLLNYATNSSSGQDFSKLSYPVTYGGAPTLTSVIASPETLENQNAVNDGSMAWAISPSTSSVWRKTSQSGSYPRWLLEDNNRAVGFPVRVSNNLSLSHQSIFAKWSSIVVGVWSAEIFSDPITLASTYQTLLHVNLICGMCVVNGLNVVVSSDAANA